ncbi:MAG TPA: ATP-binding protein [Vicinamibacterales bacterium]|nr:ATP-binding protein [Vicinamibacterales bacterium]
MKLLGSLTNRIFLASAALAVVSIAAAVYFVSRTTTRQAEAELQRGLIEAGALVDQQCATFLQALTVMARLVADDPRLKAAVDTGDPPTVQPFARAYQEQLRAPLRAPLIVLTGKDGSVLAEAGDVDITEGAMGALPEIQQALAGREASGFWPYADGVLQVMTVPIKIGLDRPEIMGALTVGSRLDHELAETFKRATESDIVFAVDGQIRASTLPAGDRLRLASLLKTSDVQTISLENGEYVALRRPLGPAAAAMTGETAPSVLLLRSRSERLQFLNAINTGLGVVGMLAVLAATILSYAVARTITRPLATITNVMREMSATGDLTRKIPLRHAASFDDEDAKLLATTFNTLTDSIARFQREAAQRERLSALGRLSTVIAHEIRNPLMIIKASLRTLGNEQVSRGEIKQALTDVDEEVARLNRIVNDVLDFARPIRFDYAPADVNALCADVEQATRRVDQSMSVVMNTDPALGPIVTDAERLRTALVNILANARHAVAARRSDGSGADATSVTPALSPPDIEIETTAMRNAVRLAVRDRGIGVKAEDMPRVFDPYFTTKRTGSGLGLAIAKNIIEGMGGTIVLENRAGTGAEIRIDLPSREGSHGA